MQTLINFSRVLDRVVTFFGRLSAWAVIPLIVVILFDIVTRKIYWIQQMLLNSWLQTYISSTRLQEFEWHLHTVVFLLALGFAYTMNAHVRVDLVRERLPTRGQAWIELLGCTFFMLPYTAVVLYFAWGFVNQSYDSGEGSAAMTGIPHRWIIKTFLLVGLTTTIMSGVSVLLRVAIYLFGPESLKAGTNLKMISEGDNDMGLPKIADPVATSEQGD